MLDAHDFQYIIAPNAWLDVFSLHIMRQDFKIKNLTSAQTRIVFSQISTIILKIWSTNYGKNSLRLQPTF